MKEDSQTVFYSVKEAVETLKLDKRRIWRVFEGYLYYPSYYSHRCSGCSCDCSDGYGCNHENSGCRECGYTGKRRDSVPIYATTKDGSHIKIKSV